MLSLKKAFYQAQAEKLNIEHLPDGDAAGLSPQDLLPVQGLALCAAHEGRSTLMRNWIDPSLTDEHDGLSCDPALDMYDPRNGPPYGHAFLERFRNAQFLGAPRAHRTVGGYEALRICAEAVVGAAANRATRCSWFCRTQR